MILGLGADLVEIARIKRIYARYGAHFLAKILTAAEIASLPANPVTVLAGRFAAKEAAAKSLGTGFADGVTFADFEIFNASSGKPELHFSGAALARAREMGMARAHLSISHERSMAMAIVILEDQ